MMKNIIKYLSLTTTFVAMLALSIVANAQTPTPTAVASTSGFTASNAIGQADAADVTATFSYVTGGSFTFATGAYVNLVKVPKGAVITDFYVFFPDIDSGSALILDIGTSASSELLLADSTVGQAGGVISVTSTGAAAMPASVITTNPFDTIRLTASTGNSGAGAGGTLKGWVRYNMRGSAF